MIDVSAHGDSWHELDMDRRGCNHTRNAASLVVTSSPLSLAGADTPFALNSFQNNLHAGPCCFCGGGALAYMAGVCTQACGGQRSLLGSVEVIGHCWDLSLSPSTLFSRDRVSH